MLHKAVRRKESNNRYNLLNQALKPSGIKINFLKKTYL